VNKLNNITQLIITQHEEAEMVRIKNEVLEEFDENLDIPDKTEAIAFAFMARAQAD